MSARPITARVRTFVVPYARRLRRAWLRKFWGMTIGEGTEISFSAWLDKTNPKGIYIGDHTAITFGATILTHDFVNSRHKDVRIGSYCLIGARSFIYPGVTIGDHCIVAAASVVMKDVPSGSLVAGNPARVMEKIRTGRLGTRLRDEEPVEPSSPPAALKLVDAAE